MSDAHDRPHDMNPDDRDPGSTLDYVVREARAAAQPAIDWKRVDVGLFEQVMRDDSHARSLAAHRGRLSSWLGIAAIAALCGGAIATQRAPTAHATTSSEAWNPAGSLASERSAGDLMLRQGSGEVRMDGAEAYAGARAHAGETIDTRGARALFEAEGRVSWLLENESKVTVERTTAALVLALAQGAVEAQVMPVASGEAFAIDVEGVRVAVHGTHLRVARDGDHVVIDLSEGTVSIGAPPKRGSTYGTLVTAPAHVEFHASALATSLSIDHDAASVRKMADVNSVSDEGVSTTNAIPRSSPSAGLEKEETTGAPSAPQRWMSKPMPPRASAAAAAANPLADAVVANAVRACATGRPHSTDLTITVSSTLTIDVQEDGFAHLASFDPPLAPDIQTCASHTIYSTRFVSRGPHKIPIELER